MKKTNQKYISHHNKFVGKNNHIFLNNVGANCVRLNSKGITLIALIITIIVMIILVGVIINVALNGGLFKTTEKAAYQTDVSVIKEALLGKTADLYAKGEDIGSLTSIEDLDIDDSLKDAYKDKLIISEGTLYYDPDVVTDEEERKWLEEIEVYPYEGETSGGDDVQKAELKVGDYVDYVSTSGLISWWHGDESGYYLTGISRDIGTNSGGWRVLKIDGDKITLISATASNPGGRLSAGENSSGRLLLKGQQLYNNGVETLNRICDELYTIEGRGKARSINLKDINDLIGFEEPETKFYKVTSNNLLYYPARYIDDNGSAIDTDVVKTDGFSRNDSGVNVSNIHATTWDINTGATGTVSGYGIATAKASTSLGVTDNSYSYNISDELEDRQDLNETDKELIKELVLGSAGGDKGNYPQNTYWIASRVVHYNKNDSNAWYTMAYCNPSATNNITYDDYPYTNTNFGAIIVNDDGTDNRETVIYNQKSHFIRPVIELDANVTIDTTITDTTDGTYAKPWTIINK